MNAGHVDIGPFEGELQPLFLKLIYILDTEEFIYSVVHRNSMYIKSGEKGVWVRIRAADFEEVNQKVAETGNKELMGYFSYEYTTHIPILDKLLKALGRLLVRSRVG